MSKRNQGTKKLYRSLIAQTVSATLAAAALTVPTISWAQTVDATLIGKTTPNAEVTARNIATGLTRHTKASAEGTYTMVGLPPGTYRVDAGPGTETAVTLTVASTATLDLVAGEATVGAGESMQQITVSAKRLVDVKTPEVGSTVSLQQIQTVPQLTRNFLEFADSVPGLAFSVDEKGNASIRGGADDKSAVNVYIDGVGQKNYIFGGVNGNGFTQGNPFPQLAIGEYKVITSNYKAEFDQVTSAAITAETKSGTNQFHGEAFGTYTNDGLRAYTPAENAAGMKTKSNDKEFGAAFGGPIIQDKLHFFVTYEGKRFNTPITVIPGGPSTLGGVPIVSLLPASAQAQFGPSGLPFTENLYFGKLDWELSDYDRFEVSAKDRDEKQVDGIGAGSAASAAQNIKNTDTRLDARWQHSADRWFNDALFTYEDAFYNKVGQTTGNGTLYAIRDQNDTTILRVGAPDPRASQNKGQRGPGFQDDLTFHALHWHGDHTLKTGFKYKAIKLTAADALDINPQFTFDVTAAGTAATPYRALFTNPVAGLDPTAKSTDRQFGVYFQDDWVVNERLTWNLGVRWDIEKNSSYLDYVTPANIVAALNSLDPNAQTLFPGQTYAQTVAKGGVNINDYISNGHNRSAYTGEFQPRLGFSFDINADQKHVVFGGYGRSYDRDLYQFLQVEQTKSALPQITVFFDPPAGCQNAAGNAGTPCFAWDPKYLNGITNLQALVAGSNVGQEADLMNNHLKPPHSDQFSLGMRNRVGDWNTSATLARVLSYDGFALTLGNRFPNGAFWLNGGQPWGNGIPGFGSLILGGSGFERKTTQVLLSAEKPYTEQSGWGATFAYTFSDAKQNHIHIDDCCAFDEETVKQYPIIRSNAVARHRLVATGSLRGPWEMIFGGKLTVASPLPNTDLACGILNNGRYFASGSSCVPVSFTPLDAVGFSSLDLQATKNFTVFGEQTAYVRVDLINALNSANYKDIITNYGSNGVANPHPVKFNTIGNINGAPQTLRLTVGYKF
jgi:outer membrane receptor protein involved in Fe transport